MGNHQSTDLNEIQALLNAIRSKAGSVEIDVEGSVKQISEEIDNTNGTIKNVGADDVVEDTSWTIMADLIQEDNIETFMEIVEEGNINLTERRGRLQLTPLHLASFHHSFNILKYLLKLPHVEVNSPNSELDTPLNFGLFSAEDDASAIQLIRYFLTRKDLDTLISNQKLMVPLLIAIQKRFAGASKLLLTSPQRSIIDQYETWDLAQVIQLALLTNQDILIDVIHQNLSNARRLQLLDDLQKRNRENAKPFDGLGELIALLETSTASDLSTATPGDVNASTSQHDYSNLDKTLTEGGRFTVNKIISPEPEAFTSVEDAGGTELTVGNIVRTLSFYNVSRGLPPGARESDIIRLSEKIATIHEITGNKIYVEVHGEHLVARMKAEATIFHDEGITKVIGDGSNAKIGSYVQILAVEEEVKKLAGIASGWIHGMGDACGRTGRIVRFLKNSDVLVQFAWGPRFYFRPDALLQSSSDKIETQDYKNNWIEVGSVVQVKKSRPEFVEIQKKNNLPYEGSHTELPWKFAVVKAIRIKAFSESKTIKISYKGTPYFVHVECIELVESVKDRSKKMDLRIGNQVQVIDNEEQLKIEQVNKPEFGGWMEEMIEISGEVGKVARFCIDEKADTNAVMVKVIFPEFVSFYFNPNAVDLFTGTVAPKLKPVITKAAQKTVVVDEDQWEQIDRKSLKCFETLGEGGFGCVVRGEWNKNGVTKVVAIKQVKVGVTNGAGPLDEVLKEAKIQFSMRHPNIVSLFGISLEKNLWIVMDLVNGKDLYNLLFSDDDDAPEYTFKQKLQFSVDMSNAIAYIHQKRYLHCDIKPHNMMVDRKSGKLYVCDFGITKFLGNMDMMSFATQYTNSVSGTLYYISPECLQPDAITSKYRKPTFAADIWALGAVFYELFTQMHLYDHHMRFLQDKLSGNDTIVKKRMADLPKEVMPIVSKALNFHHNARPSAQQLCEFFHELH